MRILTRIVCATLALGFAAGLLVGCGDSDPSKDRGGMPFRRVKLKNAGPEGAPPAEAEVVATNHGRASQSHHVGPALPGADVEVQTHSKAPADAVTVTVTALGTFTGSGSYPGASIESVEIECGPQGGVATVNFHMGLPPELIQLLP